jgi:hypothetical protein
MSLKSLFIRSHFIFCTLSIFLFVSNLTQAQVIEEFPRDTTEFIETFSDYMEDRINESHEEDLEKFVEYWESGKFSLPKMDSIVFISNTLLRNNANREPHLTSMLNFFMEINNTRFDSVHFQTWMKGFRHLANEKKSVLRKINNYFHFTLEFIESGSLYSSRIRTWYAMGKNFRFLYDTTIKIVYPKTRLKCKHHKDSIRIYDTKGVYYPFKRQWEGKGGRVTWERAGFSSDQVYATLSQYSIDMTKAAYEADSVRFINKLYFDKPILGKLKDKLVHVISPGDAIFPVFNSYQKIFKISNVYNNMDYIGGFQMKGAQFIGTGGKGKDATIKVHRHGKIFMTANAETFILNKEKALSRKASITIHLEEDSIFHTGLQFSYNVKTQNIELTANDNILSKSVYYNTYHQVSMRFDRLLWNTNKDKIYLTYSRNSSRGQASFTSMNYFTLEKWLQIEMRDQTHPLIAIRNYSQKVGSRKFNAGEYAKYMRLPTHQIRQRLMYLAQDGFIFYNVDSDTVTINDKLFDYIKSRIGKIDYDVIRINSNTQAPRHNAVLNLSSLNLNIRGVQRVFVSDSQNVVIYPDQRGLTMKKNRRFSFGGVVEGGLFTFYGDSMSFNYEKFSIAMDKIDSLRLKFKTDEYNNYGQKILANVQNTISDLTGELQIDNPENKSGKKNYPRYPIFEGKKKSYVYYDDLFNGPYKRKNFYFELYPFTMDSLDNFNPDNMKFKGTFRSAGIFPPFEETLELRPDNSLGFTKTTGEEGLPLYDGKGQYYNEIDMSNKGLKGKGKLTYLTSTALTEDVLFFPDSTSIHATEYTIGQKTTGIEYPEVASRAVNIKWYPHENDMRIRQTKDPFTMYDGKSSMAGRLYLKPSGLRGKGMLDMKKATLRSQHFHFESQSFNADTSDLKLRTLDKKATAFTSQKLNAYVNYESQRARFKTIGKYSVSEFPQNLYVSYLDQFAWQMDKDLVQIKSSPEPKPNTGTPPLLERLKDGDQRGALFMSKHRSQDSLRFVSGETTFNVANTTLNAKEVKYIVAADAKIFPNEKNLTVRKNANMDTLRDAEVLANRNQQYHNFFNADIKVKSRYDYGGNGDYTYVDMNEREQTIHFSEIAVDDSINTYANGSIEKADSFKLSPYFAYAGDVNLKAPRKLLEFNGGAKMTHACGKISPRYVNFESVINPDSIYIPIGETNRDLMRNKLFAGSYITLDSSHVYSTFMTPRKDPSDDLILSSRGYLNFDEASEKYQIASAAKLQNPDTTGPFISLDRDSCLYYAEGKMNLGVDYGKLTIDPAGELYHDLTNNKVTADLTLPVNFHFSPAALDSMAGDLAGRDELDQINTDTPFYRSNLNEIEGKASTGKFLNILNGSDSLAAKNKKSVPDNFKHTLLFSDLHFEWHTSTNSFVSQGNIKLSMVNGREVNKEMDGYIEIIKQHHTDRLYIYLKPGNDRYYVFYYFRGMMRSYSNNRKFVQAIQEVPNRKRELGGGLFSTPTYRYLLATETSLSRIRRHIDEVKETILKEKQQKATQANKANTPGKKKTGKQKVDNNQPEQQQKGKNQAGKGDSAENNKEK